LPEVADQFEATIVWMSEEELLPGRQYRLKLGTQSALATIQPPKFEVDVNSFEEVAAKSLALNGIGVADLWTDVPLVFAPYRENRELGGFILVDRVSNDTVGAGLINYALRRSHNIHAQALEVTREARAALKGQTPRLLWFTGLSGAGKSTIANLVEKKLHAMGRHSFLLDGDNVRLGLNRDLGFSDADRAENIRRVGETARLMLDAGLIVLAAFISPFRAERRMVREMLGEGDFIEVFVDVPARCRRSARSEGPLRQGPRRKHPQLHRHRLALRAAGGAGGADRHDGDERGGSGGSGGAVAGELHRPRD
jgi:bifunctional enzyme CysN/CysC